MAQVLCTVTSCKHCGRKSRKYTRVSGEPLWTCKLDTIVLREPFDVDNEIFDTAGLMAVCLDYEPKELGE